MKPKKEYAMLAVVIAALLLYLFLHDRDRTTYVLPRLPEVEKPDVTRIEIDQEGQSLVLARGAEGWTVTPGDYPADDALVDRMLDSLAAFEVSALVSQTGNYGRYELDDAHRIRVTAYRGDEVVRDFRIGKPADTMRHTHVTLAEDPNVYHARGNFRHDFDQSVADLRDKTVLAFEPDKVTAVTIETADGSLTLNRTEPDGSAKDDAEEDSGKREDAAAPVEWQTADGQAVAAETVREFLSNLSSLNCRTYLNDRSKADLKNPTHRIRIESGSPSLLELYPPADETDTEIPATSSLREDPFTLADFDVDPVKEFLASLKEGGEETPAP